LNGAHTEKVLLAGTTVDLFCRVIDNYGDIGVCWRLARQLVAEHGCTVRLIVDDLRAFRFIAPEVDAASASTQALLGVTVVPWQNASTLTPAEVVIEAFACDPPADYVQAMAAQAAKPVWLNLEYLSAETWVDDIHGRASPHPRLPLTKYFFCPGFTQQTGGLIRERARTPLPLEGGGAGERVTVARTSASISRFVAPLSPTPPPRGGRSQNSLALFAFTYPHAPVRALVEALTYADGRPNVTLAAPLADAAPEWRIASPVPQPDFDALLAQFDLLLVRGEDSFVRAQWAGKPMLWHIYPTADDAHRIKLDAWLDRYCESLPALVADAYRRASHAFVAGDRNATSYAEFVTHLPTLRQHAIRWRALLMQQTDLATRLVRFVALVKTQKVG